MERHHAIKDEKMKVDLSPLSEFGYSIVIMLLHDTNYVLTQIIRGTSNGAKEHDQRLEAQ